MKKVINITIGQVVFSIEEDAYEKLSKYLDSIKKHFAKDKDCDEILEDIEVGIAEKFLKRKNKHLVVSIGDVQKIIEQMGTIRDFEKEEVKDETEEEEPQSFVKKFKNRVRNKKLYINPDDEIIAGVASGLAAYLGVEPVLVRLAFFITLFFGGLGAVIYIFLWIVLPTAETTEQKFEMRGEKMTLQEIEKAVKEGVEKLKKKDFKWLNKLFSALASIINSLAKAVLVFIQVIVGIVGMTLFIAAIAFICAVSFIIALSVLGFEFGEVMISMRELVPLQGSLYWIFVFAVYISVITPLILLLFLGSAILKKRSTLSLFSLITLFIMWFVSLGIVGSIVFENRFFIQNKILEIRDQVEDRHTSFFKECLENGGNPGMNGWWQICGYNNYFKDSFLEMKSLPGEVCQVSSDCQLPMEYAMQSNCPYQSFCQNNQCVVGCPAWQPSGNSSNPIDYSLSCSVTNDCDCSGWDSERRYPCECLNGQCVSVVDNLPE